MNAELQERLKSLGWSDELIEAFFEREIDVSSVPTTELASPKIAEADDSPRSIATNELVVRD